MSNKLLIRLSAGVILVVAGLLVYTLMTGETRTAAARKDDTRCPDCGRELPRRSGGQCPYCLINDPEKAKKPQVSSSARRTTAYVLSGMLTFLVAGNGYLLLRAYRKRRRMEVEPTLTTRCPRCKRKLGYRLSKAGKNVVCPTCRRELTLPYAKV